MPMDIQAFDAIYGAAPEEAEAAVTAGAFLGPVGEIAAVLGITALLTWSAIAHGHHKDEPAHNDPHSGVAEDDDDSSDPYSDPDPPGKGLPPGPNKFPPLDHTTQQDTYINQSNEVSHDYYHYFKLLCRKFYNRHRRLAWAQPEKYIMALFYFMRRHRRVPKRVFNRSALIETPGDHLYHKEMLRLKRMMNTPVARRARGRVFLAS